MPIAGVVLLAIGAFLLKEVVTGRATSVVSDAKAFGAGVVNFDMNAAASALVNTSASSSGAAGVGSASAASGLALFTGPPSTTGESLLVAAQSLGSAAKGYRLGGVGPDYYDCSGLVWAACRKIGVYNGPRFTTGTFDPVASQFAKRVPNPQPGDIINWVSAGHMGIYMGPDEFYSAMNPSAGIGPAAISTFHDHNGNLIGDGEYWRLS